ncbi:MAG: 30S ribosomal protein S16 [Candidatus Chisholmbacteria bacterium]|nr:30S ribosomal protein S16 [Candidatus Chisholmbacteria bacterium]
MLKIRLTRTGKRSQPSYRIIVVERRSKRDGKYLTSLGYYNPLTHPATIKVDKNRYQDWVNRGAQPTPTVRSLVTKS